MINLSELYTVASSDVNNVFAEDTIQLEEKNQIISKLGKFLLGGKYDNQIFYEYITELNIKFPNKFERTLNFVQMGEIPKEPKSVEENDNQILSSDNPLSSALGTFTNFHDLAERFGKKQPYFFDRTLTFWLWSFDKKCYERIDDVDMMNSIDESLKISGTSNIQTRNKIMEMLKRIGRKNMPKDIDKNWVQFKDAIVNVKTEQQIQPTPEYFTTNPIPWNLGESEETPIIDRIFGEWVAGKYVETLKEIAAYCLLCAYPIHRIFCMVGSGCNGKSKYFEFLSKLVGRENICSSELDLLVKSRFEASKLYKKLVCIMGETNLGAMAKTSLIKKLSSEELVGMEFKMKNSFENRNYAKIIIGTNALPTTTDKTKGFYRRWIIIDFPNEFTEKKDIIAEIPDIEYRNFCRKAIKLLKKIVNDREFSNEGSVEERMKRYEARSNPLTKFIEEECIKDVNGDMLLSAIHDDYTKWCENNGHRVINNKELSKLLVELGYEKKRYKDSNHILGLRFKKIIDDEQIVE